MDQQATSSFVLICFYGPAGNIEFCFKLLRTAAGTYKIPEIVYAN
jgi:hypothetical protein